MIELDHQFTTGKPAAATWAAILDLERVIPCVEGGRVTERTGDDTANAEIRVKMGAMSLTFSGTVAVTERDDAARRAVLRVDSREQGGQGTANAEVSFVVTDGGGTVHTAAEITGKAASMGEGVMSSVLDALIADFTEKLSAL